MITSHNFFSVQGISIQNLRTQNYKADIRYCRPIPRNNDNDLLKYSAPMYTDCMSICVRGLITCVNIFCDNS